MNNKELATFDNDCFDRKDFAENLCNLIKGQEGYQSRVISIKADFGYGKTYFAKALKNMIDSQDPHISPSLYCHYIDIWKEDYNHNPLLALLSSLDEFVEKINFCKETTKKNLKDNLKSAVKTLSIELLKEGASHIPYIGKTTVKAIETMVNYKDTTIFKDLNALKKVAGMIRKAFAEFKETSKMIIIIDEIDRCHPEYAIEFLETLKHFFDLENLYFILMMNENHLREKVKSKFGYIDFDMWKDKFINLEFELPNARSQEKFLRYLICEKYEIQNQSNSMLGTEFKVMQLVQNKDLKTQNNAYVFNTTDEKNYNFAHHLTEIIKSLNCQLNNRQLESICLHLSIALSVLKNKPICPLILFGFILKTYLSNINLTRQSKTQISNFYLYDQEYINGKYKYTHVLKYIFDAQKQYEQNKGFLPKNFHTHLLNMEDIFNNIKAAQFALQGNGTQYKTIENQDTTLSSEL